MLRDCISAICLNPHGRLPAIIASVRSRRAVAHRGVANEGQNEARGSRANRVADAALKAIEQSLT